MEFKNSFAIILKPKFHMSLRASITQLIGLQNNVCNQAYTIYDITVFIMTATYIEDGYVSGGR